VHALLGGKLRETVDFASYLFCRYANPETGKGEVRTAEQLVANAAALKAAPGITSHKLKGGVYPPRHELACYRALAASLPGERFRYDPNSALSLADAIEFGRGILDLRNDYYEDPVWGMPQLKRLKDFVPLPIATTLTLSQPISSVSGVVVPASTTQPAVRAEVRLVKNLVDVTTTV
jgi:glucarate dehydratase